MGRAFLGKFALCVAMQSVRTRGQVFKAFSVAQNGLPCLGGYSDASPVIVSPKERVMAVRVERGGPDRSLLVGEVPVYDIASVTTRGCAISESRSIL